jgi:hypothetical protein
MYNLEFYTDLIFKQEAYDLPESVIESVRKLHLCLGVNTDQSTAPVYVVNRNNRRNRNDHDELWKKREAFKTTVIAKAEGNLKLLSDMKNGLNKLSAAKYDIHAANILETVNKLLLPENNIDGDMETQIFKLLTVTACTNSYWSGLYATLCKSLLDTHEQFIIVKDNMIHEYNTEEMIINVVDPNENYEQFCEINKQNDKRRSRLLFIINLYKNGCCDETVLIEIIKNIESLLSNKLDDKEYTGQNDEFTELINVFITNMVVELKTNNTFAFGMEWIRQYSKCKPKDNRGFTSRSMFKFMDMVDLFK